VPALWINRSIQIGVGRRQRDWPENGALIGHRTPIVHSSDEKGSGPRRHGRLQPPARTVQFRLVPWQNFVEAGAIFSDALFVALLDHDLPVPLHPVEVIEHRK